MSLARIAAIVRADFLIRFRRASTVVLFLLLGAFAYLWVPDPATGRALITIGDQRAIYNSAAIGMATAMLATIFMGLAGFYVVSNAIRRDAASRCGFVLASTTMRSSEYLLGKLAGNILFLSTFVAGFMLTSMAMLLVRGEAPLEPLVFVWQYLLLVPPAIVFVSVIALVFESVPLLSGRFGDVAYFFLWVASIAAAVHVRWFDFTGFAMVMEQIRALTGDTNVSIGASTFDASKPLYVFTGVHLTRDWIGPRLAAIALPLPLLGIAQLFFHRFDPARVRATATTGWRLLSRLNAFAKPLARLPLRGRVVSDASLTLAAAPLALVAAVVLAFVPHALPVATALGAVVIADLPTRDRRSGTLALVYSTPRLREHFILWKIASSLLVLSLFLVPPALRSPAALPALAVAAVFLATLSTALGTISGNPKTFIVVFLSFWYVVVNDKGATPALDFAGFFAPPPPATLAAYAALAAGCALAAHAFHHASLRRD